MYIKISYQDSGVLSLLTKPSSMQFFFFLKPKIYTNCLILKHSSGVISSLVVRELRTFVFTYFHEFLKNFLFHDIRYFYLRQIIYKQPVFGWVLWHINHCKLFNAKSSLYIYIRYIWFALIGFNCISTITVYLMPNPLYTYILDIYDLLWLGFMAYQPL